MSPGNSLNVRALNQTPWTIAGLNELVPENLLAIFDENELEVCVMFIMKVYLCLKRHLGILCCFFPPLLTSSAADVWHRRYKCAGLQGPCGDCRRIVAFQGESTSQDFCALFFFRNQNVWACLSWVATGDEVVLGRGVQLHPGGASSSAAVHHRLLSAAPGGIQHSLPLLPDHRCAHTQHAAHCTHVVSKKTQADVLIWSGLMCHTQHITVSVFPTETSSWWMNRNVLLRCSWFPCGGFYRFLVKFSSRVIISQNSRLKPGLCGMLFVMILGPSVWSVRFYTSSLPCLKMYKSWGGPGCNNIYLCQVPLKKGLYYSYRYYVLLHPFMC